MTMQTIDQKRSKHAWAVIESATKSKMSDGDRKDFATHAKKLPTRIINAGLGQALAFVSAKAGAFDSRENGKQGLRALLECLDDWTAAQIPASGEKKLLKRLMVEDASFLRRATDEVMAYLNWLNRHAESCGLKPE